MNKRSILSYSFDILLIFVFFYAMVFKGIPFATSKFVLLYLFIVVNKKLLVTKGVNNSFLKYCFTVGVVFSAYYFSMTVFSGNYNFGFLQQTSWFFFEGIFGSYCLFTYLSKKYSPNQILYLIVWVFLAQSLFVIACYINSNLRDLIDNVLVINDDRYLSSSRMKGFSNSGGAGLSYLQTIGVFTACSLFLVEKTKRNIYFLILSIVIITVSQIFIARTGMFFSILIIAGMVLQRAINKGSLVTFSKQVLGIGILAFLVFNAYFLLIPSDKAEAFNDKVLGRALEFYENYESSGEFSTNSTTALNSMYFLPKTELQTLFGAGIWDDAPGTRKTYSRQVDSDVGYVRIIFAVGLFASIFFYSIYFRFLKGLYESEFSRYFKLGLLCLLLIFVMGEFKEPFLIRSSGIIKSLCLIYFIYTQKLSKELKPKLS